MITEKIAELAALRARTAALEEQVQSERKSALASLPAQYGFTDAKDFVAAVIQAVGRGVGRSRGNRVAVKPAPSGKKPGRKARAKVTDETRAEVKKLVGEGKTGAQIAKAIGVSVPTVQNIKKALGLVRGKRK